MIALNNVAWAYWQLDDLDKAHELYEKVYMLRLRVLGEGHTSTLFSLNRLAIITAERGDKAGAMLLYMQEYELRVKYFGADDEKALAAMRAMEELAGAD